MYEPRLYRNIPANQRFSGIEISRFETDLWIAVAGGTVEANLYNYVNDVIISLRDDLYRYRQRCPEFFASLEPLPFDENASAVVQKMLNAGIKARVGPMAAVAGAFAEEIGIAIKQKFHVPELIIENGGDIFLDITEPVVVSVYAGGSPLSDKVALRVPPEYSPLGICSSSGKFGHSKSFGNADVVTISCRDTATADAFATAFGNRIHSADDIKNLIAESNTIDSILSALIIADEKIGIQGKFELQLI